MFGKGSIYTPQPQAQEACVSCEFHLKGCCFDPAKNNKGFLAAPCFGCKDISEEP